MTNSADFIISGEILEKYNGTSSEIAVPRGIKELGMGAFRHCRSLKSLVLPNSIIRINNNAFEFYTGLTDITMPNSVMLIASSAFSDSPILKV